MAPLGRGFLRLQIILNLNWLLCRWSRLRVRVGDWGMAVGFMIADGEPRLRMDPLGARDRERGSSPLFRVAKHTNAGAITHPIMNSRWEPGIALKIAHWWMVPCHCKQELGRVCPAVMFIILKDYCATGRGRIDAPSE